MDLKRTIFTDLKHWKSKPKRKPLLLLGARQVGKTTTIKKFGEESYESYTYFNFEETPGLCEIFQGSKDPERIITTLSLSAGFQIEKHKTLIILDEIQECGDALTSLKYFQEKAPDFHIIAAGSLLVVTLGQERSFPVSKVDFMKLHPLTFGEFLQAADSKAYDAYEHYSSGSLEAISGIFFEKLHEYFKQYFILGGMPEVTSTWLESEDIQEAQNATSDILSSYSMEFVKHAPSPNDIAKIQLIWDSIPSQLAKENKKFLYKTVKSGARAREYETALLWLEQAGLIHKINRCEKPLVPLRAYEDLSAFKIYALDMGILAKLAGYDRSESILHNDLYSEFHGAFTENYISQALHAQLDIKPMYWTSEGKAELDFIVQYSGKVIPVEVKSGNKLQGKSLSVYDHKYDPEIKVRFSQRNIHHSERLLNLPIFYADYFTKFIDKL